MIKLTTARLIIQVLSVEDDQFIFDLLNSPGWLQHIGDRKITDLEAAQAYIHKQIQLNTSPGFGMHKFMLRSTREPAGLCGFLQRDYLDHPDIGFAILPGFMRNGYTREASEAMIQKAETDFGFRRMGGSQLKPTMHLKPFCGHWVLILME